ncbi:hypothetical protein KFE25_006333 [Diacronema lutheri]|uniref:Uncharacterized protein n=2 Tax=Diacronema lutheri TaxID=2081491 RepID=A0A8J5XKR3_DIALT|nr:hypothetical protein KFE25_006333 [Diacronema lutheri]
MRGLGVALLVCCAEGLTGPARARGAAQKPPLRACAAPPPEPRPSGARLVVGASLALGLVNGGAIFGWPGLRGLLESRGVALSAGEWARMYTVGTVAFSGSAPIAGNVLDRFGPRAASALAGALCALAFVGLALCTRARGLTLAYAALSVGGFCGYLASISLGNSEPSRFHAPPLAPAERARMVTRLSCLVDVSAITFVALHAAQRRLGGAVQPRTILIALALATAALHTAIWRGWTRVYVAAPGACARGGSAPTGAAKQAAPRLSTQLRSSSFAIILLFATVHSLSSGHALAHLPARVGETRAAGRGGRAALAELASLLMTAGCLPAIPLVSACLDKGLGRAMTSVNVLGLAYVALSLAPGAPARLCSAVVFAAYRGLLYSTINLFHAWVFGPAVMGRTIGAMSLLSSFPLFALQLPIFGGGPHFARAQRALACAFVVLSAATELYVRREHRRDRMGAAGGAASAAA